jgi:hypothetical protein
LTARLEELLQAMLFPPLLPSQGQSSATAPSPATVPLPFYFATPVAAPAAPAATTAAASASGVRRTPARAPASSLWLRQYSFQRLAAAFKTHCFARNGAAPAATAAADASGACMGTAPWSSFLLRPDEVLAAACRPCVVRSAAAATPSFVPSRRQSPLVLRNQVLDLDVTVNEPAPSASSLWTGLPMLAQRPRRVRVVARLDIDLLALTQPRTQASARERVEALADRILQGEKGSGCMLRVPEGAENRFEAVSAATAATATGGSEGAANETAEAAPLSPESLAFVRTGVCAWLFETINRAVIAVALGATAQRVDEDAEDDDAEDDEAEAEAAGRADRCAVAEFIEVEDTTSLAARAAADGGRVRVACGVYDLTRPLSLRQRPRPGPRTESDSSKPPMAPPSRLVQLLYGSAPMSVPEPPRAAASAYGRRTLGDRLARAMSYIFTDRLPSFTPRVVRTGVDVAKTQIRPPCLPAGPGGRFFSGLPALPYLEALVKQESALRELYTGDSLLQKQGAELLWTKMQGGAESTAVSVSSGTPARDGAKVAA